MQDITATSIGTAVKYRLTELVENGTGPTVTEFNSAEDRLEATVKAIFGIDYNDLDEDAQKEADKHLAQLEADGFLSFEGDPGLEWSEYIVHPLQTMFDKQFSFNKMVGVDPTTFSEQEKIDWILKYTRAASQEIAELIDCTPWKHWANYQKFDEQNARVEVVDLFHFLISMAQVLGMTADDLFAAYNGKMDVNIKRQQGKYATKNPDDSRHL